MNVQAFKKTIRARDKNKCRDCKMTNDEHIGYFGKSLHVHRLVPGAPYDETKLVTLCRCCHKCRHGMTSFTVKSVCDRLPPGKSYTRSGWILIYATVRKDTHKIIAKLGRHLAKASNWGRTLSAGEVINEAIRRLAAKELKDKTIPKIR